ncbi:phosphotransferase [Streptomyces sp. NBC_00523]|uniref:phosphotransferase n=1 Tax=Streptomyces sp. NBC_00523 TaxID=2975765 RepID=UPI003FCC749E
MGERAGHSKHWLAPDFDDWFGLQVCRTAGLQDGVLFTRIVPGTSLAEELIARPWETAALLNQVLDELRRLHSPAGAACFREAAPITERSVVGVFRRKFGGQSSSTYLRALGEDRGLAEYERQEVVARVETSVRRLLAMADGLSTRRETVVFGDLKPEHVFLIGSGRLTLIDPAMQGAAGPEPDIAKLAGRALLLAIGLQDPAAGRQIVQGVADTVARHVATLPEHDQPRGLRELLLLWLMDTVSILSTCLSAPPGLPLTRQDVVAGRPQPRGEFRGGSVLLEGEFRVAVEVLVEVPQDGGLQARDDLLREAGDGGRCTHAASSFSSNVGTLARRRRV